MYSVRLSIDFNLFITYRGCMKQVAVLDIGSSKLELYVGEKGINHTFVINAKSTLQYAGFMDGEFIEPGNLNQSISQVVSEVESTLNKKLKKLYVGVPAEFLITAEKDLKLEFSKRTKITSLHVEKLFGGDINNDYVDTHEIINIAPMYYVLGDGTRCLDPVGKYSTNLKVVASFIYASNDYINTILSVLNGIGLYNIEFIASPLATATYLLDEETREKGALLVDCGYISTSVSLVLGEGLQDIKAFSIGGGHITADLSEHLNLPFFSGELLKRKTLLCIDADNDDYYEVNVDNKIVKVGAKITNSVVLARLDTICDTINRCIDLFDYTIPSYMQIYLTGGGISYIKGAKDYLQEVLGRKVIIVSPWPPQLNLPELSGIIGLLDTALYMEKHSKLKYFR